MKRLVVTLAVMIITSFGVPRASAERFGDQMRGNLGGPFAHLRLAAETEVNNQHARCPNLTVTQLEALMLAPTWAEVTGGKLVDKIPSPMALPRYDDLDNDLASEGHPNKGLYFRGENRDQDINNNGRVYWHPSLGFWQVQDRGLKSELAGGGFHPYFTVAHFIADRYCGSSATDEVERVRGVYGGTWYGCDKFKRDDGKWCQEEYDKMWKSSAPDSFQADHIPTQEQIVDYWGEDYDPNYPDSLGMPRSCTFGGVKVGCAYVDGEHPDQDAATWWAATQNPALPLEGGADGHSPAPLARPFYIFYTGSGRERVERRIWLNADIPQDFNIMATRPFGKPSYGENLTWKVDAFGFCDTLPSPDRCA